MVHGSTSVLTAVLMHSPVASWQENSSKSLHRLQAAKAEASQTWHVALPRSGTRQKSSRKLPKNDCQNKNWRRARNCKNGIASHLLGKTVHVYKNALPSADELACAFVPAAASKGMRYRQKYNKGPKKGSHTKNDHAMRRGKGMPRCLGRRYSPIVTRSETINEMAITALKTGFCVMYACIVYYTPRSARAG